MCTLCDSEGRLSASGQQRIGSPSRCEAISRCKKRRVEISGLASRWMGVRHMAESSIRNKKEDKILTNKKQATRPPLLNVNNEKQSSRETGGRNAGKAPRYYRLEPTRCRRRSVSLIRPRELAVVGNAAIFVGFGQ